MHDLDRALQELESDETMESDYESYEENEGDYEGEGDFEAETSSDSEAVFDELEEMEHAASLLEVQDEEELDQFLGGLISKVKKKLGAALPMNVQQALGGALKRIAKAALPKVGAALGNLVIPGVGGALAGGLMSKASKLFGLELEGMSHEDQEFEVARRVVGLTAEATKAAAQAGTGVPAGQAAKDALLQAAQTHAPGLVNAAAVGSVTGNGRPRGFESSNRRTGRWFRRGRRIILVGA